MRKILMFVYNDLTTDARVQRTAFALSKEYEVEVVSFGKTFSSLAFKTHNIKCDARTNLQKYIVYLTQLILYCGKKKYDILYAHDYSVALPALLLKFMGRGQRIVYDAHELYIPVKAEIWSRRDQFFYFFEAQLIKNANLVISAQKKRSEIMQAHHRLKTPPIVIRNISKLINEEDQLKNDVNFNCKDFFSKTGRTIVYAGALTTERKVDQLVRAVSNFCGEFKLLIIGSGQDSEKIKKITQESSIVHSMILDSIPHQSLGSILKKCDIGYVSYPTHNLNNIYCAPNKIYEYASVHLPIVGNDNPTLQSIVDKWQIGVCGDNITENISKVSANLDWFVEKTIAFDQAHSWEKEAEILRKSVGSLFTTNETKDMV